MILNASKFIEHFRENLPGSWEMETTDGGMFLNLRVRDVMSREGLVRIEYNGQREVAVTQPKLYPMATRAPYRLQAGRSYRLFFDVDLIEDLPEGVHVMVLEHQRSYTGGLMYSASYRTLDKGVVWMDITMSTDVELGLGVPIAKLAFFGLWSAKATKTGKPKEKEDAE